MLHSEQPLKMTALVDSEICRLTSDKEVFPLNLLFLFLEIDLNAAL